MNSKRIFSWSKRQSGSETYYRTGGLLPIDTSQHDSGNGVEAKAAPMARRTRPAPLRIIPPDNKQLLLSPLPTPYINVLSNAASSLQTAFNDILRSPAPGTIVCTRPASIHKPLPGRPRSLSLPSSPDLPAELPGSLLLENQGFPSEANEQDPASQRPVSHNVRRGTHPPCGHVELQQESVDVVDCYLRPLNHSTSVPNLNNTLSEMRSVRSGNALNAQPNPQKVQRKKSLSDANSTRRPRPDLGVSPSSSGSKPKACSASTIDEKGSSSTKAALGASTLLQPAPLIVEGQRRKISTARCVSRKSELETNSTPTPTTTRSKQIEELKATIAAQDHTISTLQAQFGSLRASHETHIASLTRAHLAEVATLKIEEQLARRPLHHASSNNLLFYLETTEPQTPGLDILQPTETGSASSTKSFQSALEKQQRSPQRQRNSPEMESLKRKLSTTRRTETTGRNLLPELNQYKQNNIALQKQIESLMAKLNESKKSERALKASLEENERRCEEWQSKAEDAGKLAKGAQALQNTIDHLENRLEIANTERLDAEEQLCNLQAQKSPFDFTTPALQVSGTEMSQDKEHIRNAHLSMSTVFSSGSPTSPENESQELSTLAAFIAHIERLQDQARQKDAQILELETERDQMRQKYDQLQQDYNANNLRLEIQDDLLHKTQQTDAHMEQLRGAIIDRETVIEDKEKALRAAERQLSLHKLLLHAEIRRHAAMSVTADVAQEPLPELSTLASKADIDRWITRLQERLRKERNDELCHDPLKAKTESQRKEIEFYIREIIYYKLDIRGYKSDIKKLKRITAQLSSYGSRASDLDSETSSLRREMTPNRPRFAPTTPELASLDTSPSTLAKPAFTGAATGQPITPPLSGSAGTAPCQSVNQASLFSDSVTQRAQPDYPMTPQTPTRKMDMDLPNQANDVDEGTSPRSISPPSPQWRRPMPLLSEQDRTGEPFANFPFDMLAAPQESRGQRSSSESTMTLRAVTKVPEAPDIPVRVEEMSQARNATGGRIRSSSLPESSKGRTTPERPPRPHYGLFESHITGANSVSKPLSTPHTDVLAEALRCTTNEQVGYQRPSISRSVSNASSVRIATPMIGRDIGHSIPNSTSILPQAIVRAPVDHSKPSTENTTNNIPLPPERKLSGASASSIPFVIAMGSPHNPALISPTTSMSPGACSITRNAPLKIPTTSRIGIGGTMASNTPITSPTSPKGALTFEPPLSSSTTKPLPAPTNKPARKFSLSRKQEEPLPPVPRTPSHSRNVSGSSIRTAIRMPKAKDKEDLHKMRKDSISMPRPLGSPFTLERSSSTTGAGNRKEGENKDKGSSGFAYGIGEAF